MGDGNDRVGVVMDMFSLLCGEFWVKCDSIPGFNSTSCSASTAPCPRRLCEIGVCASCRDVPRRVQRPEPLLFALAGLVGVVGPKVCLDCVVVGPPPGLRMRAV